MSEKIKILLVEDNPGDVKLVKIYLSESSTTIFEIKHASKLIDAIKLSEEDPQFSVALLDLSLPDSMGFDTLHKAVEAFPKHTAIIVLTGMDNESIGIGALKAGAQDYIVKGQTDSSSLIRSINYAIERKRLQQQIEESSYNLKVSEQRLLQAQRIAKIGNYELYSDLNSMSYSQEFSNITEIDFNVFGTFNDFLNTIPDDNKEFVQNAMLTALLQKNSFNIEHPIVCFDSIKYVRNQGQAEFDVDTNLVKLVGTLQDITQYKLTEQNLAQQEQYYSTIFNESQDAIYITSKEGIFIEYNKSFVDLFGYTAEEFKYIYEPDLYVDKTDRVNFQQLIHNEGTVKDFEVKLRRKNNEIIDCLITSNLWLSPIDNTIKGYHGIIRDITTQKQTQELLKAKQVAEQSARVKQQFLENMSHEIRTPMNVVVGMAHLLENTPLTNYQKEYIDALKLSANTLLKLINNILDFSKIESGKLLLEKIPFKIEALLKELVQTHKFKAKEKQINLYTQIDADLPEFLIGDSIRLQQVMNNLISNAIKYTHKGEVNISVKVLKHDEETVSVGFFVKDTGIGVPPEKQNLIFESFSQASEETTRKYGGTGLGLSIAQKIVELQGGKIKVESKIGLGSTFYFDLTFPKYVTNQVNNISKSLKSYPSDIDEIALYSPDLEDPYFIDTTNYTQPLSILLVEDHRLNQIVATDLLKRWANKLNIIVAENGAVAIDALKNNTFDVILMDISMPILDGYETTIKIRTEMPDPINKIPIIAMTAHAFNKSANKCYEVGMNDFLTKPINPEILYHKLNKILKPTIKGTDNFVLPPVKTKAAEKQIQENFKINLAYIDSLSGGDIDLKIVMIETLIDGLPFEISKLERDCLEKNWEQLKQSAHKIKSSCNYLGLESTVAICKNIEDDAWDKKNLEAIPEKVNQINNTCNKALQMLKIELNSLKAKT